MADERKRFREMNARPARKVMEAVIRKRKKAKRIQTKILKKEKDKAGCVCVYVPLWHKKFFQSIPVRPCPISMAANRDLQRSFLFRHNSIFGGPVRSSHSLKPCEIHPT